jgi:hypothetical protein
MDKKTLQHKLNQPYSTENWKDIVRFVFPNVQLFGSPHIIPVDNEKVKQYTQLGNVKLFDGKTLAVFDIQVADNVKIVRNRKALREIAAKYIDQEVIHGALALFYHPDQPDYRFSFISKESLIDIETGELVSEETQPKRYTYVLGENQSCITPTNQLWQLMEKKESDNTNIRALKDAFSLETLNKEFYSDYQRVSRKIIKYINSHFFSNKLKAHQGALNMLNRILFIYFIQKKDWLMGNPNFLYSFWNDYQEHRTQPDTFHKNWLNKIFFSAFNGKAISDPEIFTTVPLKYHEAFIQFPYLNGGLFTFNKEYDSFTLPDVFFSEIFDFLQRYNFTINEDAEDEVNMEINPELLGKMYEGMINATDLDDVEAEHGIVYTERPEINFMTRRSFVEVLYNKLNKQYSREFLYHFCFDKPAEKIELLKRYKVDSNQLKQAVLSITACDPACGSGSMLIGVIQLQVELIKCLEAYDGITLTPKDDFLLKKRIISESIYGVDVKEWAVRIAELRFWLYMIAEAEFTTEELIREPLLPNLDFKLRCGNSLIQEAGGVEFSLEGLFKKKDGTRRDKKIGAARKLNDFIKKKKAFVTNQSNLDTTYQKLKEEELQIFKDFIIELIFNNNKQIKSLSRGDGQITMFDEGKTNLFEQQVIELEKDNEELERVLKAVNKTKTMPFSFDIDFMEVFLTKENPGFDLIIGNPPYVRQEDILPADDALELERLLLPENKAEKASKNKTYKEELSNKVFQTYPFLAAKAKTKVDGKEKTIDIYGKKVPGRSDLYVYFQLLCPALLNREGVFCFIISNSWLDVEYGGFVQQFLLKHAELYGIYDCNIRSFSASVNTIIYLHGPITNKPKLIRSPGTYSVALPIPGKVRFTMNKLDYNHTAYAPLLIEQENCRDNTFRRHYRVIVKDTNELWDEAYDTETLKYQSNKWGGKYLRAPEIYYKILEKGKDQLVPFKKVADVRFGIKTGANEFFILSRQKVNKWGIENEFLVPILKSPRECKSIQIEPEKLPFLLFYCHKEKNELEGTNALRYIKWGEESEIIDGEETRAFHLRPSTRSRRRWWDVGNRKISQTVFPCGFGDIFKFYVNKKVLIDKRLYEVDFLDTDYNSSLNSSITPLFLEIGTRTGLGDGLMDVTVYEAKNILIFQTEIQQKLINRDIKSIFLEFGFDPHISFRQQRPNPLPDRKALDDIIFDELGLTEEERNEVYWATAELVKQRLDKAGSR